MASDLTAEDRALLALHLVPGIGPRLLEALLEHFGSAEESLRAGPAALLEIPHLGPKVAGALARALDNRDVDAELALLEEHRVQLLRKNGPGYPPALANIPGAPPLLFVRGDLRPTEEKCIGLVGSRTCTSLGKRWADKLARELAAAGWTVVSGLARGIDVQAHNGALEAGGRTIAVLAGGLKKIYPPEHAELAEAVVANGALVTESGMRMEPLAGLFPARNRIISGLSRGVIIIEAGEKSGALITARHALDQGREVFTLPGPVDGPTWSGNHLLLRQGARLVRNARDVLEDLEDLPPLTEEGIAATRPAPLNLSGLAQLVWDALSEPRSIDLLADQVGQSVVRLTGTLIQMELSGVIRRLPGNVYERGH